MHSTVHVSAFMFVAVVVVMAAKAVLLSLTDLIVKKKC